MARRQPDTREFSLRPAEDAADRLRRNQELPRNCRSRMGLLTAQPEVQPDYLFLHGAEGLQEVCHAIEIHGHLDVGYLSPLALQLAPLPRPAHCAVAP